MKNLYSPDHVVKKLREADILISQGQTHTSRLHYQYQQHGSIVTERDLVNRNHLTFVLLSTEKSYALHGGKRNLGLNDQRPIRMSSPV